MNSQHAVTPSPSPMLPNKPTDFQNSLRHTGIPVSWFSKRPKLPSRNWLIFLSVTSAITGYYIYDRNQCKHIRQHYIDLVKGQAEEPVRPLEWPRRVTVYGSKWPGDEDYDQPSKYFRKYVKPILVAAAVDFEIVVGKRHGDIAERIADEIRLRRRRDLGIDPIPEVDKALPTYKPPDQAREHELNGGIVIIGRPTFKEFMAGLQKGWTEGLESVDHDELLARELEVDGHFDEMDEPSDDSKTLPDSFNKSDPSRENISPVFSPLQIQPQSPFTRTPSSVSESMNASPPVIPPVPPLLLVSFTNHIGLSQVPIMIWEFFNQRQKVRSGAEAGYHLVMKHSRPVIPPANQSESMSPEETPHLPDQGDLAFDKDAESYYKSSLSQIPTEIEKARKKYYEELPAKVATARALARGTREPTKEEATNPPPTEVELTAERMRKEKRWRRDIAGWELVNPNQRVIWDDRYRDALRIFIQPPSLS